MKRISFNWEITAGHVMQLLVMLGVLLSLYADSRVYKAQMEMRLTAAEQQIAEARRWSIEQSAVTQKLSENVVKLSILVEERTSTPTRGKAFN